MLSWFEKIRKAIPLKDILLIASIPIVLILIFILPASIKESLILQYQSPTLLSFYFTHFVHEATVHLLGNLISYIAFILMIYLLAFSGNNKKMFYTIFFAFVFILPLIISVLDFSIIKIFGIDLKRALGFSGMNSAFLGILPYFLLVMLKRRSWPKMKIFDGAVFFLFLTSLVVLVKLGINRLHEIILLLTIIVMLVIFAYRFLKSVNITSIYSIQKMVKDRIKSFSLILLILLSVLYVVGVSGLFPVTVVEDNFLVGILSHYIGLSAGIFVTMFLSYRFEKSS